MQTMLARECVAITSHRECISSDLTPAFERLWPHACLATVGSEANRTFVDLIKRWLNPTCRFTSFRLDVSSSVGEQIPRPSNSVMVLMTNVLCCT